MMKHLLLVLALSTATVANGQTYLPPYVENFEDSYLPGDWTEYHSIDEAQYWQFGTAFELESPWDWPQTPELDGKYAILHMPYDESAEQQHSELISPAFDFTNSGPVRLFFNHSFTGDEYYNTATLSYRIEYGSWRNIKTWTASTPNPDTYNELIPEVAGKAEVQFKWSIDISYYGYWAIDNVTISEPGLTATWNGLESDNWYNPFKWDEGFVPNALCDVVIPAAEYDIPVIQEGSAICKNITIEAGGNLEIFFGYSLTVLENFSYEDEESIFLDSGSESSASLIAGSVSGTGSAFIAKNMSPNRWFYVSSPVNQSISSFLNGNPSIPTKDNSRGMMDFNTGSNDWNPFFANSTSGSFERGKGYAMRLSQYGGFSFSGPISAGIISNPLSTEGLGWNLVGNPYTSAIALNYFAAESNFLEINQDALDPSFVSVYLWDGTQYEIINYMTTNWQVYASMGQGFFVKANPAGGNLTFNRQMQVHRSAVQLKSGTIIPGIKLQLTSSDKTVDTDIKFVAGATTGLDVGYDAGILKADPAFAVFTRLVQDNNVEFALQCLPEPNSEIMTIPVGVDFRAGGEITFTAEMVGLSDENSVVLEDKLLNVSTTFDNATSKYSTTAAANAESTGRFFLHVSGKSQVTAIDFKNIPNKINAWVERDEIVINGTTGNNAVANLFDVRGSSVLVRNIENKGTNRISVNGIPSGIYMLQVIEYGQRTGIKLQITGN
jgi:hypothetical protein